MKTGHKIIVANIFSLLEYVQPFLFTSSLTIIYQGPQLSEQLFQS